ncbi:hypothetical protein CATRI_03130 [Corynebacterium atrinae]|uniref:M48 metallopeptidase family protein n=1 Tax=Corynebacterium atrinae TaxID=1336740 RepID=UPI0025B2996D|nr:SprT-like domain-containing protein [Corynebacterium atrinae]WJY62731.1 hypothetical protein CATRI_03130 [Corynebacterium atrinae]
MPTEFAASAEFAEIEVIRSARRTRTVQARQVGQKIIVRIPARMSAAEEKKAVASIVDRLRHKTTSSHTSDEDLQARAEALNNSVLEGRATVGSIRWVANQQRRWGSCTPSTGDIRISDRLKDVPSYVVDAVIVHELTHTFIPGHGPEFWVWADKVPKAERAKGYLEAYQRLTGTA